MRRVMRRCEQLADVFLWLSIAAGIAMMLHVVADFTGRFYFNRPFAGTTEIVGGWYMVAIAFLPWAWIAKNDQHIVAGMFQQLGSRRVEHWLEFIGLFVWQTTRAAISQTRAGEVLQAANMYVPVWPSRWILPASGALMVVYLVLRIIHDIAEGPQDKKAHPVEIA
jgi:TRAP-type C4-dicarboxylate transport system permease small subunit